MQESLLEQAAKTKAPRSPPKEQQTEMTKTGHSHGGAALLQLLKVLNHYPPQSVSYASLDIGYEGSQD